MATSSPVNPMASYHFLSILLIVAICANKSLAQKDLVKEIENQLPSSNNVVGVENGIPFPQQTFNPICAQNLRKNLIKFLGRVSARQDEDGIYGFLQAAGQIGAVIGNALTTEEPYDIFQSIAVTVAQVAAAVNQGLNGTDTPNITSFLIKQGQQFIQALLGNRGQTQSQNQNQGNRRPQRPAVQVQKLPATVPPDTLVLDEDEINEISIVVDAETTKSPFKETTELPFGETTKLPFSKLVVNRLTTTKPPVKRPEQESAENLISVLFSLVPGNVGLTTARPMASVTRQPTRIPTVLTTSSAATPNRKNPVLDPSLQEWLASLQAAKVRPTTTTTITPPTTTKRQGFPDSAEGGSIKNEIPSSGSKPIYWMNMYYPFGVPSAAPASGSTKTTTTVKPRRRRIKSTTTNAPEWEYYEDDDASSKKPKE